MFLDNNGQKIFAATGGKGFNPEQPLIVFLHGAGMDHTVWALQTRYFAHHGYGVLALDLPGHGQSEGEAFADIKSYAQWLGGFWRNQGFKNIYLVGHSLGALIALECAALFPDLVGKLALLGVAATMPVHPDMLKSAQENGQEVVELMTSWGHGRNNHLGGNTLPGAWIMGNCRRLIMKSRPGTLYNALKACHEYKDGLATAASIGSSTRLILGSDDMMTPAKKGQELGAVIKGAKIDIIPNCGHMLMNERPDAVLDLLI